MENKKRVFTVLSIEGGGVRGIVPARILQEIEERTGKPIAELFDLVGGTSTGSIIGAGLLMPDPKDPTKPALTAKDLVRFYHEVPPIIFPEKRLKSLRKISTGFLYDPKPFEEILEKYFGDLKMKDALKSLFIPATDIKNFKPIWIKNIKGQKDTSKEGWSSMFIRDALRAATSAPMLFPAKYYETTPNEKMPTVKHRHALIDGSFFGGNTIRHLLTQAKKMAPPDAEIIVVHIGTGNVANTISPEEYNKMGILGLIRKSGGSALMSLLMDMGILDMQNDLRNEIGDKLFTFDGSIDPLEKKDTPSASIDNSSPENIKLLEKLGESIIQFEDDKLDRLCTLLKHKEFIEEIHLESQESFKKLTDELAAAPTIRALNTLYIKILRYNSQDLEREIKPEDKTIATLARDLNTQHKEELDRIYHALLDEKKNDGVLINRAKEAKDTLTKAARVFLHPFKENVPPAKNDNEEKISPPKKRKKHDPKK